MYGARGANGVIVINTKRGREGNVEVNFKATLGVSSRAIPDYDLVNQREFVELNWQSLYNTAYFTSGYTDAAARAYASSRLSGTLGANYNPFKNYSWDNLVDPATGKVRADAKSAWDESWIDNVTEDAAFRQEYQASVSGGNNVHRGSMSLSYLCLLYTSGSSLSRGAMPRRPTRSYPTGGPVRNARSRRGGRRTNRSTCRCSRTGR